MKKILMMIYEVLVAINENLLKIAATPEDKTREEKINKMFTEGLDNILSYGGKHAE